MTITPVIMSGGSGSRLWPVSREARPKQFHALAGEHTLIQAAALRAVGERFAPPVVVCNARQAEAARAQLAEIGVRPGRIVLEPAARNTAPCAVAAAALLAPEALMLLMPADHRVTDIDAFHAAVDAGRAAAEDGALVVFGLKPTRPESGYGYIRAANEQGVVRKVAAFVEKPDLAVAEGFVADPAYSWNAGIFLFSAGAFLMEARRLAPEAAAAAETAAMQAVESDGLTILGPAFNDAPAISIDYAVMEKTERAMVVTCDMGWSDVGAWRTLWELASRDTAGNALQGRAIAAGADGCFVRTDGPPVVVAGVDGLTVVVQDGVVLVTPRDGSEPLKAAVEALKTRGRRDLL